MRIGLRLRLFVTLGILCVVAFVPLYFAVSSLSRASVSAGHDDAARALGRALCSEALTALSQDQPPQRAIETLATQTPSLVGIAVFDQRGNAVANVGRVPHVPAPGDYASVVIDDHQRTIDVATHSPRGVAIARVRVAERTQAPLVALVGFYTAALALTFFLFSFMAVTRLVVRPIEALTRSARRVAVGARILDAPVSGASEIIDLGASLASMTAALRDDELALRSQLDAIERANAQLRDAQSQLLRSERLASVGRLAAGLAHEVGNPLAALLGFEDLLLAGGLSKAEERDFLVRMRAETERIHRIVRDLLDFARPGSQHVSATLDPPGNVAIAVRDVVNLLRPQRDLRERHIVIEVDPELPLVTLAQGPLVQTVLNLLLNAADATQPDGHICVRAQQHDRRMVLEVEDDGPGIEPAIAAMLFEPFVTTKEKGTGLGLAVCRGLVENAGGSIATEARPDGRRGALFRITLPVV